MIRIYLAMLLMAVTMTVQAQRCSCIKELQFLENKVEHNLPSYYDQVVLQKREKAYKQHRERIDEIAASITDSSQCIYLTARYISFFRDEHLAINYKDAIYPFSWEDNDTAGMRAFFSREKVYRFPHERMVRVGPEGYWSSRDGKMKVQVIANKNALWDYIGLVVIGDKKYWTPGQIKFALKKKAHSDFECIYLSGSRKPTVIQAQLKDSVLNFGRITEYYRIAGPDDIPVTRPAYTPSGEFEFNELSPETAYLRIPSFDYENTPFIDSLVKTNLPRIVSKRNIIIDVRDNEGGSDRAWQSLLPLVYDKREFISPMASTEFGGPDIIAYYEQHEYENCKTREDSLQDESIIMMLKKHPGEYMPLAFDKGNLDTFYKSPKNVAILMDRWCASSTEGFILAARQNKKVKLYGENTWGMCSYGDWMTVDMPCLPVAVNMPTKKMTMRNGADYESIGISPDVKLNIGTKDKWIAQVQDNMEHPTASGK